MKKSSFVALVLGTVSGLLFALGMCMALLPEWNAFAAGVACGCLGAALGVVTVLVYRKMTHKAPIRMSGKTARAILVGVLGALLLGVGMCCCMVWNRMVLGIAVGMLGIVALMMLIPLTVGMKE